MFFKNDFLTKMSQDIIWRERFHEAIATKEISSVKKLLESIPDMTIIIRLVEQDEEIKTVCFHPELESFWNEAWRLCGRSPMPQDSAQVDPTISYHDMLPEQNTKSFDLVRGMYFYNVACSLLEKNSSKLTNRIRLIFTKASQYGSLYADFELVKFHINQFQEATSLFLAEAQFSCAKEIAMRSKQKHSVPGIMLLFYVCYQYAKKLWLWIAEKKQPYFGYDKEIFQKIQSASQEALLNADTARVHYVERLNEVQNYTPRDITSLPPYLFSPKIAIETIQAFCKAHHILSCVPAPSSSLSVAEEEDAVEMGAGRATKGLRLSLR